MLTRRSEQILSDVLTLLRRLSDDWDREVEISAETHLFGDLGLESLDIVVLGTTLQEQYGQVIPFPEFFARVGQRQAQDIAVQELVDFIDRHLNGGRN